MVDATAIKSSVKQIAGLLVPQTVVQGIETPFQVMFDPSNKEISDSSDHNPPLLCSKEPWRWQWCSPVRPTCFPFLVVIST